MKYLQIALNVPANQTFTYANVEAGKRVAREEPVQKELIPQKRARKVDSYEAQVGSRAEVMFGNKKMTGIIVDAFDRLPEDLSFDARKIRKILRVIDQSPLLTKELLDLGRWLSSFYLCPIGEALCSMIPGGRKEVDAGGFSAVDADSFEGSNVLSAEQAAAVEAITAEKKSLEAKESGANSFCLYHYLYGATGSGKTEVFLSAAQKILERGKGVLYLVPEIGPGCRSRFAPLWKHRRRIAFPLDSKPKTFRMEADFKQGGAGCRWSQERRFRADSRFGIDNN